MSDTEPRLTVGDGVVLGFEASGSGPPVVLLHGFTGDASTMRHLATAPGSGLARDHRVIIPDLVGHGGSAAPDPAAYSVEAMAAQVGEALDRLEPGRAFDLIGYSMGGRVALTLACRSPERVRSLVLIGASAGLATDEERRDRIEADEALARSIEVDGLEVFVDRWMANPLFATQARLGADALAGFRAQRLRNDGTGLARSLRAAGTGRMEPLHGDLARCLVPTALVVGADDPKFRAIAADLARGLANATVEVIEGAGHAAHLEQPAAVLAVIRAHIAAVRTIGVAAVTLPLRAPMVSARGATTERTTLVCSIPDGPGPDGLVGWGEASPLPGWSHETLEDCRHRLPAAVPGGFDRLGSTLDALLDVPAARAAVAGAALDLEARRRGILLRDLLAERFGADPAPSLEVNAMVAASSPDAVAAEVAERVAEGYRTVKLKVAVGSPDLDLARIAAARAVAADLVLRLDANGGWDAATAVDVLGRVEEFGIALCEEPVEGIEAIAAVGARVPVPVAVDESARRIGDYERVWRHTDHIAAVIVKPQALGGADLAMAVIGDARRRGVDVVVTAMVDSAIGVAHAAHVAAAAALPGAHGLATGTLLERDVAALHRALPIVSGRLSFAADRDPAQWGPGLGIGPVSLGVVAPS